MSIQTELTRITNAKAAIKTAIEVKGVTVPDGTKLDSMAALIESIVAGGGGGGYNFGDTAFEVVSGSFTTNEKIICNKMFPSGSPLYLPFEDMTSNVKKGRGRWFVLWDCVPDSTTGSASEIYGSTETNQIIAAFHFYVYASNGDRRAGMFMYKSSSGYSGGGGGWFGDATSINTTDSTRFFGAGRTYQWVSWTTRAVYDT